jgi:small conductance mechanosensitive channel
MNLLILLLQIKPLPDSTGNPIDSVHKVASTIITDVTTGQGLDKMSVFVNKLISWGVTIGVRILGAVIILVVGRFLIKLINRLFDKLLTSRAVDSGVRSFLRSLVNALLVILLIIAVVNKLGIETTSFAALLASFGVAIGMAMSGNLSNFVGGMLILMFKPYRVGDWIKVSDVLGQVVSIEIFHTVLKCYDGTLVYMSNGNMSTAVVRNYSRKPILRIEFKLGLEYGVDVAQAEKVLLRLVAGDDRVEKEPAPYVALDELADSSVNVILRLWVKKEDYWKVRYDFNRKIYDTFNREGIGFAFPQITVHQADN